MAIQTIGSGSQAVSHDIAPDVRCERERPLVNAKSLAIPRKCDETHMDDHRRWDGASSLKWYQSLFGHPRTPPDHDDFGQILDTDGTVLLCLHQWGAHG
jgi:hypothetical protein